MPDLHSLLLNFDGMGVAMAQLVVGIDGSPQSRDALAWALRLAPAFPATIHCVIAWQFPNIYGWGMGGLPNTPEILELDAAALRTVNEVVEEVAGGDAAGAIETSVVSGNPASALIHASASAAMLVVGSRGLGGFTGLLLGSVSIACTEHAKCPVLVVRGNTGLPPDLRNPAPGSTT